MIRHVIYCHGFGSSPSSKKASLFRDPLVARGVSYHVPDLNRPSFTQLTLTAQLEAIAQTIRALPEGDVALIGSSMGGLAALHFVDSYVPGPAERVTHLVLLAPALDFYDARDKQMGAGWQDAWYDLGYWNFFNYATGKEEPVHYDLMFDLEQYDSYAVKLRVPTLIYHGLYDESVDYHQSVRFAEQQDHVTLRLLHSDHQLLDKTDEIAAGIIIFLGL
ncbi:MAG: alpha/beta fold hydrolase [Anaerolineae bacterium]|nr:alpha/beta fold hydrolase [Anaerolineae bacterium]MDW8172296.1 YqiA/YcfP family alpha/beta fold hydrolase [Anaerolineae bacterium]